MSKELKVLIGTELHLSERFSQVWTRAAIENNLLSRFDIVIFDNNPEGKQESDLIQKRCKDTGLKYWRNPPNSRLHNTVDNLATMAREGGYEYYVHLDIDCPPVQVECLDVLLEEVDRPGVAVVTDRAGAHFVAFETITCSWMPAGYHPMYEGMKDTRFRNTVENDHPNVAGYHWFDECRWIFQHCVEIGKEVVVLELPLLHPCGTSFNVHGSRRWRQVVSGPKEYSNMKTAHRLFWSNPIIKQLDKGWDI